MKLLTSIVRPSVRLIIPRQDTRTPSQLATVAELTNTRWTRPYLPTCLDFPGQCFTWGLRAFAEDNTRLNLKLALFKLQSANSRFQKFAEKKHPLSFFELTDTDPLRTSSACSLTPMQGNNTPRPNLFDSQAFSVWFVQTKLRPIATMWLIRGQDHCEFSDFGFRAQKSNCFST